MKLVAMDINLTTIAKSYLGENPFKTRAKATCPAIHGNLLNFAPSKIGKPFAHSFSFSFAYIIVRLPGV